ncbi:MAG: RNA polymerase sigma factor [Oligoflexales bacterium]
MNKKNCTNEDLLRFYSQGDFASFDIFFKRNSHMIFMFIFSRSGNKADSEDILQETFFKIHKYIHTFNPEKNALNWVFTIAMNTLITHHKSRNKHLPHFDEISASSPHSQIEARNELQKILATLSHHESSLIIEKFLLGKDSHEMSETFKSPAPNIRKKLSRLLQKIRYS